MASGLVLKMRIVIALSRRKDTYHTARQRPAIRMRPIKRQAEAYSATVACVTPTYVGLNQRFRCSLRETFGSESEHARGKAGKLGAAYEFMRVWLDHEHFVPVDFGHAGDRTGTVHIRVGFVDDDAAGAFEREFSGWELGSVE